MSTFSGLIDEYPNISIDNFIPLVSTYFISHLHLDHIKGFENFIPIPNIKVYTSQTTEQLFRGRHQEFKYIIPFVKHLEMGKSHTIAIKNLSSTNESDIETGDKINVTLIPSGHCLGSVMFLFEGYKGQVLYTGDFRIPFGGSHEIKNKFKIGYLEAIYFDSTFLKKSCLYFPSREESIMTMLDLIDNYLLESPKNIVQIYYTTRYTLEILYHLVYLRLNIKVHIQWDYYSQLSELGDNFLAGMDYLNFDSRVHACYLGDTEPMAKICIKRLEAARSTNNLLKIIPSAIWWSDRGMGNGSIVHRVDRHTVRVCFSSHSSYTEIVDLLLTLRAHSLHACVAMSDHLLNDIMNTLLSDPPPS